MIPLSKLYPHLDVSRSFSLEMNTTPEINKFFIGQRVNRIRWSKDIFGFAASGSWYDKGASKVCIWEWDLSRLKSKAAVNEDEDEDEATSSFTKEPILVAEKPHIFGDVTQLKWISSGRNHSEAFVVTSSTGSTSLYDMEVPEGTFDGKDLDSKDTVNSIQMKQRSIWKFHSGTATDFDYQPASQEVVSVGEDCKINAFKISDVHLSTEIKNADDAGVNAVRYLNPNVVCIATVTGQVKVWDLRGPTKRPDLSMRQLDQNGICLFCLDIHPDQPYYIATGGSDGHLSIWDLRIKLPINKSHGHSSDVWQVSFHPTIPSHLFTCSQDGTLADWNCSGSRDPRNPSFTPSETFQVAPLVQTSSSISSFDFDPRQKAIICSADNESLLLRTELVC